MPYFHDPKNRDAVSQVCRRWYELDSLTRKHVTIALCCTTTPDHLRWRFLYLESLKLKGKPWTAMFNLILEDWGGYVMPWVKKIADYFDCLKSLHFRRMIVGDSDLELAAWTRGHVLLAIWKGAHACCVDTRQHVGDDTDALEIITQTALHISSGRHNYVINFMYDSCMILGGGPLSPFTTEKCHEGYPGEKLHMLSIFASMSHRFLEAFRICLRMVSTLHLYGNSSM